MVCWRLADILLNSKALLNTAPFGDEPLPLHFRFQAALNLNDGNTIKGSLKPSSTQLKRLPPFLNPYPKDTPCNPNT